MTPNMGLWWYFFAEIFEHFRAFFLFVLHIQPLVFLLPLSLRLAHKPVVLTTVACLLIAIFKVRVFRQRPSPNILADLYRQALSKRCGRRPLLCARSTHFAGGGPPRSYETPRPHISARLCR